MIFIYKQKYMSIIEKIFATLSGFTDAFLDVILLPVDIIEIILNNKKKR